MIRIKDIAEIAQVSNGTVDRVIHNRGGVSRKTREKVQQILNQYHYKPDIIASSLALKRKIRLAVVMPRVVSEHAFWKLPLSGLEKGLDDLSHYDITVDRYYFDQFDPADFNRCVNSLPYEKLQGILFAPVFEEESLSFLKQCEKNKIPVVLFNSYLEAPVVRSFIGQDAFQSGYVAAKLLNYGLEPGRDVAIVNMSARKNNYAHVFDRERGFRSYFEEHSGRLNHLLTIDLNGMDDKQLKKKLHECLNTYDVAGLFVTNSRVYKVAEFFVKRGTMNLRLVGYDLLPGSIEYLKRDYIDFLISQKPEEQAFRGITTLFNLVAFNREPDQRQMLPIDIITRENLTYYQPQSY